MSKTIIHNHSSAPDSEIVNTVALIMKEGRVSNNGKQYCYLYALTVDGNPVHIVSDMNKSSDRFIAYDTPQEQNDER